VSEEREKTIVIEVMESILLQKISITRDKKTKINQKYRDSYKILHLHEELLLISFCSGRIIKCL
jgi:hypothetical protein